MPSADIALIFPLMNELILRPTGSRKDGFVVEEILRQGTSVPQAPTPEAPPMLGTKPAAKQDAMPFMGLSLASSTAANVTAATTWASNGFVPEVRYAASLASLTVPVATLSLVVQRSIDNQSRLLGELGDNWDGYGALALPKARINALAAELRQILIDYQGPLPDISPGSDGSIQAEWRLLGGIEVYYGIDAEDGRYFNFEGTIASVGEEARGDLVATLAPYYKHFQDGSQEAAERRSTAA